MPEIDSWMYAFSRAIWRAHLAKRGADAVAELPRREDDEREEGEHDEREAPVEPEHDDDDPDDEEAVAEQADEHRGEELVDRGDVVRRAGHEAADGRAVEERDREAEDVARRSRAACRT